MSAFYRYRKHLHEMLLEEYEDLEDIDFFHGPSNFFKKLVENEQNFT